MKNWVTKKNILLVSLFGTLILVLLISLQQTAACYDVWNWCRTTLWEFTNSGGPFLFPVIVVFLISLLTYKLRNEIFHAWLKFSVVYLPIMLFFVMRSSESAYGGFLASAMTVTRAQVAFQLSLVYLVGSLLFVAGKWFALRKTK